MSYKISDPQFFKEKMNASKPVEKSQPVQEQTTGQADAVPRASAARLNAHVIEAVGTCATALKAAGMQELAAAAEKVCRSAMHDRFTVAVVGEFNRGKSTFINRFLQRDFLPVGNLPTTAVQTRIRYSARETLVAFNNQKQKVFERPLSQESWESLTAKHFGGEDFQGTAMVGIHDRWLRDSGIELMDTPGAGDLSEARARVIGDALLGCDGAIIAVNATMAMSVSEKLFIEERLIARKIPFLMLIVTKLDMVPLNERADVLRFIQAKLKSWNMDIPVYVPYPVELPQSGFEDCIGMEKIRAEIERWICHPERLDTTEQWVKEKTANIMDCGISALTEQKLLLEAANEERRETLTDEKKKQLQAAKLTWSQLHLAMQKRCTDCYSLLLDKVDEYSDAITERLQYEAGHAATPPKWWQEDYPYRLKVELTNMAAGVENVISRRISEDAHWYSTEISKSFRASVLFHKEVISDKELFGDFRASRNLEFENLDKKRNAIKIGSVVLSISGVVLFSTIGFLPIIATMGIGTATSLISEKFFKDKIEQQRLAMKDAIARSVPAFIQDSMAESEDRLKLVYEDIMQEAEKSEQMWLTAQQTAIDAADIVPDTNPHETICRQIEQLERARALVSF